VDVECIAISGVDIGNHRGILDCRADLGGRAAALHTIQKFIDAG
jgi:hypothetical protein